MQKTVLIYVPIMDQTWGGVRQYTSTLLRLLAKQDQYRIAVLHDSDDTEILGVIAENKNLVHLKTSSVKEIKSSQIKRFIKNRVINVVSKFIKHPISPIQFDALSQLIADNKIDIVHCPYQYLPTFRRAKGITTFHDLQELYFPEFFSASERGRRASQYPLFLKKSNAVFASYNHVKDDIIKFFSESSDRIFVALLQMDNHWVNHMNDSNLVNLSKFHLPEDYVIYPANAWKHKNHQLLIHAAAQLRDKHKIVNIAFTGNFKNEQGDSLIQEIKKLNLEKQIHLLGIVNEDELYSLYKNALGVVVPTLYEAGSFPLMEAILLGIPVICSTTTSLPETIGSREFTFDPKDPNELAEKLELLYFDKNYRDQSRKNALSRKPSIVETGALKTFIQCYNKITSS